MLTTVTATFSMRSHFLLKKSALIGIVLGSAVRCCSSNLAKAKVVLYYNDVYEVILPPTHKFPMMKYKLVREGCAIQQLLSRCQKLLQIIPSLHFRLQRDTRGISDGVSVEYCVSPMSIRPELETTHCPEYIERFFMGTSFGYYLLIVSLYSSVGTVLKTPNNYFLREFNSKRKSTDRVSMERSWSTKVNQQRRWGIIQYHRRLSLFTAVGFFFRRHSRSDEEGLWFREYCRLSPCWWYASCI